MTSHETAIAERLHDAASRIRVDTRPSDVISPVPRTGMPRSSTRRRVLLAGVVVAAAAMVAVQLVSGTEIVETGPADGGPAGEPSASPSESYAAHVVSPPAWFGEPRGAHRANQIRTGRWVTMAIGRGGSDEITQPITISVFDGTYGLLDDAEDVTIDGVSLRSLRMQGWQALATVDTPTVMVTGSVDEDTLFDALDAVEVVDPSSDLTLRLGHIPEPYTEIVAPRPLGPGAAEGRVLAGTAGETGIDDASDWTDPLLAAVNGGYDVTAVDIEGTTGWFGTATSNPSGPILSLTWSPRPGIVLAISTSNTSLTVQDLVDLALTTIPLPTGEWDAIYAR